MEIQEAIFMSKHHSLSSAVSAVSSACAAWEKAHEASLSAHETLTAATAFKHARNADEEHATRELDSALGRLIEVASTVKVRGECR